MHSRYPRMRPLWLTIWRLRHSRLRSEFHGRVVSTIAATKPEGWVPDVGSGPGLLARRLTGANPGLRVVCIDVEPGMLRAARRSGCPYLVRATADRLPIRSGACATVVSTATLKDWADRAGGLSEIARVLRPEGIAFIYDFVTVGPGSDPAGFIRRFGLVSELLRRRMGRMIPFSLQDLEDLATAIQRPGLRTRLEAVPDLGAAELILVKQASV